MTAPLDAALIANGYEPVPCIGKRPIGDGWQVRPNTPDAISTARAASPAATNTGLRTGSLVGLDIDIIPPDHIFAVRQIADAVFGPTGLDRLGSKGALLCYRNETPVAKTSVTHQPAEGSRRPLIEILGTGQQFIAYGDHPDTGQPYQWRGTDGTGRLLDPGSVPLAHLPLVTPAQLHQFAEQAAAVLAVLGYVDVRVTGTAVTKPVTAPPPSDREPQDESDVIAVLRDIDPGCDYDRWIRILCAIKGTPLTADGNSEDLACRWSAGEFWPGGMPTNYDGEETITGRWAGLRGDASFGSLLYLAGRTLDAPAPVNPADTFRHLLQPEPAADVPNTDDVRDIPAEDQPSEDQPSEDQPSEKKKRDVAEWDRRIIRSKNEKGLDVAINVCAYLRKGGHPLVAGRVSYDEFARCVIVSGPLPWHDHAPEGSRRRWTDADDRGLAVFLQYKRILASPRVASDAVDVAARQFAFHPVRDYLKPLRWDGQPRLASMLATYFGADQEPADYLAAVGSRWMISAVARIFEPGCQADHALIFEGMQGEGKSTALRTLAVHDDWFADQLPDDVASRSASLCLDGKWIVELSELSAMRRSDIEPVKAFISRRVEHYDPKFSNRTVDVPRQCVFAGSTNESEYLRDATGNRRFWPVRCGRIDLAGLVTDRDQLWAEAVVRYRAGERWWIDPTEPDLVDAAAAVQHSRLATTSRDDALDDYLNGRLPGAVQPAHPGPLASTTLAEIFAQLYSISDLKDRDPRIEQDIARRLAALGWERRWVGPKAGPREKRYFRPQRGPYRRTAR